MDLLPSSARRGALWIAAGMLLVAAVAAAAAPHRESSRRALAEPTPVEMSRAVHTGPLPQTATTVLTLAQRFSLEEVPVGGRTIVTITITNTGNTTAPGIALRSELPNGLLYLSSTPDGTESSGTVTWLLGALGANQSLTVDVTLRATQVGNYNHRVSVRSDISDETTDDATLIVGASGLSPNVEESNSGEDGEGALTGNDDTTAGQDETVASPAQDDELARTGSSMWLVASGAALLGAGLLAMEASTRAPSMGSLFRRRRRRLNRPVFVPVRA